jgi:hypothetical protein
MHYLSSLTFFLIFISSIFTQNILSFQYTGGDSLFINMINEEPVAGFQFQIPEISITEASGGLIESNQFLVQASESDVVGFSLTGGSIESGAGHMLTLFFDLETSNGTPCFNLSETCGIGEGGQPCTFLSNVEGNYMPLNWENGECASGCFDNSACNSLTAEDCIYAMTYYQDIDNDSMGNELITQMYCDDEIPESGWVLGPDDGGNSFDVDGGEECPDDTPADCSGVCGGDLKVDDCDICGGSGPEENYDCDGNCLSTIDECGVCGGNGPEQNYDCAGECTQLLDLNGICCDFSDADCSGICQGTEIDEDEDGICDDVDTCIEEIGASQECGCNTGLADEACDCDDNVLDECGICGGDGIADGLCDCDGNVLDECGACSGGGIIDGACDCEGNILDCAGECGGLAVLDECDICNGDGIADGLCDCDDNVLDECGVCGGEGTSCLSSKESQIEEFTLIRLYPNPFNPTINIEYSVANPGYISLKIIGLDGQIISTLVNGFQANGRYNTSWSPENISTGVYLLQLESNKSSYNDKIIYLK